MNRLTVLFIFTTSVLLATSIALAFALIQEAARSSEYSQASYKLGLKDGESYVTGALARALAERELIEEAKAHIAEERL